MKIFGWAAIAAMLILAASAGAVAPAKKKAPPKKGAPASTASKKKAPAKTTASARKGKVPARKSAVTWRNRQTEPTPARYKEIQQALADKGYLHPEDATGTWSPASAEAMKKFQADQNLEGTGKINSLSLIALGLGPKHDTPTPAPVQ
jgi:peptidoglycan hydrolase-like protein with peptidoglycan-binding domain